MEKHEAIALGHARKAQAQKLVERIKVLDPEDPERARLFQEMLEYGADITALLRTLSD